MMWMVCDNTCLFGLDSDRESFWVLLTGNLIDHLLILPGSRRGRSNLCTGTILGLRFKRMDLVASCKVKSLFWIFFDVIFRGLIAVSYVFRIVQLFDNNRAGNFTTEWNFVLSSSWLKHKMSSFKTRKKVSSTITTLVSFSIFRACF